MKYAVTILVAWFASIQLVQAEECRDIKDPMSRLACYDRMDQQAPDQQTEKQKEVNQASAVLDDISLRDKTSQSNNPASISVTRSGGETASVIKVGLTWKLGQSGFSDEMKDAGWSWYVSGGINRDTLSKQETNARDFSAGATGNFFRLRTDGFSLLTQFNLNGKDDLVANTRSNGAAVDATLILNKHILEHGTPYNKNAFAYAIYPKSGIFVDDQIRVKMGETPGTAYGAHLDLDGEYYPGGVLWRLKLYGESKRALDLHAGNGLKRRSSTFNKGGIDYALIDPRVDKPKIIPSIALERMIGGYFLDGTQPTAQTVVMLKLKVN